MAYVGGQREQGCVFCNRITANDDSASLILDRREHSIVILNLFPYNTGHLMLVPTAHTSDPADLDVATLEELGRMVPAITSLIRRVMSCEGINIGVNLGAAAGAGIADHLHEHFVPRWSGDANFMPLVGGVKVLPEHIPATYAKLRLELAMRQYRHREIIACVMSPTLDRVWIRDGQLPAISIELDGPVWKELLAAISEAVGPALVWRWLGQPSVLDDALHTPVIGMISDHGDSNAEASGTWRSIRFEDARHRLPDGVLDRIVAQGAAS